MQEKSDTDQWLPFVVITHNAKPGLAPMLPVGAHTPEQAITVAKLLEQVGYVVFVATITHVPSKTPLMPHLDDPPTLATQLSRNH